jgi:outer membrane protein assembly factor BamB
VVYAYGSGEETKQAFPDIGLNFDSTIRASKSGHVTLYALDAETGKELWSSGDTITSFNHFNGLSLANGKLYLGTYDGTFWAFGLPK